MYLLPESTESKVFISTKELLARFNGNEEFKIEHTQLTIDEDASTLKRASDSIIYNYSSIIVHSLSIP